MFEQLLQSIQQKEVDLSQEQQALLKTFFIPKKIRKRQYLLQEGDVCKYSAFVEKGALRSYTIDEKGNEFVVQFALEGWWIADNYSLYTGAPAVYNIDVLEDSELLLLSHPAAEQMLHQLPPMERYFRLLLQNNMIAQQRRLISSIQLSSEEKYLQLLRSWPTILKRVPQHMIASYLGITPETLSRIRRQLLPK